jgi:membrane-associated phospholipid phosphatase
LRPAVFRTPRHDCRARFGLDLCLIVTAAAILAILSANVIQAQPRDAVQPRGRGDTVDGWRQSGGVGLNLDYLRGYLSDTGNIAASALAWRPADWLKVSLLVGATLRLADEDEDIKTWVQRKRDDRTNTIAAIGKPFGDGIYTLPVLGVLYCCGRFSGNERLRRTALLGCESVVVSGVITGAIKYLAHKPRPSSREVDGIPWGGPAASTAHLSFPSGHSACAFAIGTVVAMEYKGNALVPPLAYAAAALCAFSRVNDNAHWMSDVIVGSAIGHLTARAIVGRHGGGHESRLGLEPLVSNRGTGLSLSYRF